MDIAAKNHRATDHRVSEVVDISERITNITYPKKRKGLETVFSF